MASSLSELNALLTPSVGSPQAIKVLGAAYHTDVPGLQAFADTLAASEEFAEDWNDLKASLDSKLPGPTSALADARLLMLFSHYLVTVRATAESGELLPQPMMTWIGKGAGRIPAENTVWFLLETEGIGSEAARDVINVVGGETTFLGYFFGKTLDAELLEQGGVYLAMLLHLRHKWPDYYAWMPMNARMNNMRALFLMGSDELEVTGRSGKHETVHKDLIDVYDILSKTMYQVSFFVLLQSYVAELRSSKGVLSPAAQKIRSKLLED
jgi:hypothetical protein